MASLSGRKEVEAELLLLCKTRFMGLRAPLKYVSGDLFSIAQEGAAWIPVMAHRGVR